MPTNGLSANISIENSTTSTTTNHNNNNNSSKIFGKLKRTSWNIKSSEYARNTLNHIRYIVEGLKLEPNPEKPMIPLSIGDPTTFGNLRASDETFIALKKVIDECKCNGYGHTSGFLEARKAVAKYSAHQSNEEINPDDIILCSGCSSSLDMCISSLAEKGQNILVPRPGFCLYKTLAVGLGVEIRFYDLIPEKKWEVDLNQMESLIDENTAALVVNNPSNPCGSVFKRKHLQSIIKVAEKHFVPIIADEIYEHFVFPGAEHIAVSSLSKNVPVLSCGGLTKRFLVPGWRMGWIIIHDRNDILKDVSKGIKNLTGRILGPNTLIQGALPDILEKTPQKYFDGVIDILNKNAKLAYDILKDIRGLKPVMPAGAMYMMIGIDIDNFPEYTDDLHFVQELVAEQSVFCLPGACFDYPNYIRIVLTVPDEMVRESCSRIAEFCEKHYKIDNRVIENGILEAVKY